MKQLSKSSVQQWVVSVRVLLLVLVTFIRKACGDQIVRLLGSRVVVVISFAEQ